MTELQGWIIIGLLAWIGLMLRFRLPTHNPSLRNRE